MSSSLACGIDSFAEGLPRRHPCDYREFSSYMRDSVGVFAQRLLIAYRQQSTARLADCMHLPAEADWTVGRGIGLGCGRESLLRAGQAGAGLEANLEPCLNETMLFNFVSTENEAASGSRRSALTASCIAGDFRCG